jgi:hypothetical protein
MGGRDLGTQAYHGVGPSGDTSGGGAKIGVEKIFGDGSPKMQETAKRNTPCVSYHWWGGDKDHIEIHAIPGSSRSAHSV